MFSTSLEPLLPGSFTAANDHVGSASQVSEPRQLESMTIRPDAEFRTRHNIPHDIKIYAGARHSFFNEDGKAYDAAAAADSWRRSLDVFAAHLRGPNV